MRDCKRCGRASSQAYTHQYCPFPLARREIRHKVAFDYGRTLCGIAAYPGATRR